MNNFNPKSKNELSRNFRIISMKNDLGKSFTDIAFILNQEAGEKIISPQRVAQIYNVYKNISFKYDGDKIIIN